METHKCLNHINYLISKAFDASKYVDSPYIKSFFYQYVESY